MSTLRHHLKRHRFPAALLVMLALAVRLIVPAGFMPMAGQVGLQICAGQTMDMPVAVAAPAMASMPDMGAMHGPHVAPAHDADHGKMPMSGASDHDCGFGAAIGGAADLPVLILPALLAPVALPAAFTHAFVARPGLGLAAPRRPRPDRPPSFADHVARSLAARFRH